MKKSKRNRPQHTDSVTEPATSRSDRTRWLIVAAVLALIALDLYIYAPVRNYPLVNYDDPEYVGDNAMVKGGLTTQGVVWAFTTDTQMNWHPLTWLSHMLDVQLFGMNVGMHHVTNLFFHVLNTVLLFWAFYRMTGELGRSAFVAALFGVHPAHVQSVAWISERKDVLSAFFWILTMLAYTVYVRKPGWQRYLLVAAALALGLMAKPMLVTLPLVLLLLDVWPLNRIPLDENWTGTLTRRLLEKVPLLMLVAASSVVTFLVQSHGAIAKLENASVGIRLQNALQAYVAYIGKAFWPTDLALLYPFRFHVPAWRTVAALVLVSTITLAAVWLVRRRPSLLVGWLWFVGTLVPVIGLVQVGVQGMADRYTYIPFIGLFVAVAWALPKLPSLAGAAGVAVLLLAFVAHGQTELWRNSVILWRHTVRVTENNPHATVNLGNELFREGRTDEAIDQFLETVRLDPRFLDAQYNLGIALMGQRRFEEAEVHFREAISIKPDYADAHSNLGLLLAIQGKRDEALKQYSEALRSAPNHIEAHSNMGALLMQAGRVDEALAHFSEVVRLDPSNATAHNNLAGAFATQGKTADAIREYSEALRIKPDYAEARSRLETFLAKQRR